MNRVGIRVAMSGVLLLTVCALSACKPSYGTKETPIMTTAAQEVEIPMDFDQIHNDVQPIRSMAAFSKSMLSTIRLHRMRKP